MNQADKDLLRENRELRQQNKRLEAQIVEAGRVIHAADEMWDASQGIPQAGYPANRELAEKAKAYKRIKDRAKREQEGE